MISAVHWMPRGRAKAAPTPYEPTEEEMEEMRRVARDLEGDAGDNEWEDASDEEGGEEEPRPKKGKGNKDKDKAAAIKAAKAAADAMRNDDGGELAEYNLDRYDEEPGANFTSNLAAFASNAEDPYITLPDEDDDSGNEEDNLIRPNDDIVLCCHSEEEGHTLEVYVYDQMAGSLFVHHDLMLNAFPLCVEWGDCARADGVVGSYAAIGTMDTEIEVWDLDCIDSMLPVAVLGGEAMEGTGLAAKAKIGGKKKKKQVQKVFKEGSHRDAVLGLAWHKMQRHVLASCSADKAVKIWDVPQQKCLHTLSHHTDKVQGLQWHPSDAAVLLTGSFDRNAAVCDVRATAADWKAAGKWPVSSDVECITWDPHNHHQFLVSTDQGEVTCHDARHAGQGPIFTIGAHTEACTGLQMCPQAPGLLATASLDRTVKLWDVRGGKVEYVASRTMQCGQVFCCTWSKDVDSGYTLAIGGKDGRLHVWNTAASAAVRQRFETGKSADDFEVEEELQFGAMSLKDKKEQANDSSDPDATSSEDEEDMDLEEAEGDGGGMDEGAEAKQGKKMSEGRGKGSASKTEEGREKRRVLPLPKKVGKKKHK